ncbi:MAG: NAD-dependent epimerase/dehydratase family protein [Phycisphaerales bacterium]
MSVSRRDFLASAVSAAALVGAAGAATPALARLMRADGPKLNILILGGTSLTGPQMVAYARTRGHKVTVFNRGRTEKRKGSVGDDVERLLGDRDPAKGEGLKALEGDRTWDVVIDTSGYYPRIARASAELLAKRTKQYIFISTISVYKDGMPVGSDETATLATMPDPTSEDMAGGKYYGALKVLCENVVQEVYGKNACIVRPGLIVGPGDDTDRFTYWPVRVAKGGEVLAPNTPADPIQYIDCRDLGEWCIRLAESGTGGVFNAAGPVPGISIGTLLDACKKASGSDATFTWVPSEFLAEKQVAPWGDMPVWVPPGDADSAGMSTTKSGRAVAKGLTFRPVEQTVKDILAWWPGEIERRKRVGAEMVEQAKKDGKEPPNLPDPNLLRAGISRERELKVLEEWKAKKG